jgi:putative acetyltransferase
VGSGTNVVRPVRAEDVPNVVALVTRVLAEFGLTFGVGSGTDDAVRALPGSYVDAGGAFWIAERAGDHADADATLLGTCGVFPVAPRVFELRKMYLDPRARGLGVGQQLFDVALAWTRAHGGERIVLDTIDEMTAAIGFYEKNGFVRDDAQIRGARCTRGYARAL